MSDVGYSLEEIQAERERRSGRQQQTTMRDVALSNGGSLSIEDIRRERARRSSAAQGPQRPRGYSEFSGAVTNFGQGLTLGGYDEITGAIGGVGDAVGAAMQGRNIPEAFRTGFDRESERTRSFQDTFLAERPNVGNALQGTGAAAPALATAGTAAAFPAGRGIGAFAMQTARSGTAGAAYGGTTGFLDADGGIEDRAEGALQGTVLGGAFGAAAPAVANTARGLYSATRPARSAITRLAERIPTGDPAAAGMFGGNIFTGRGNRPPTQRQQQGPTIPQQGRVADMFERARVSPDDFAEGARRARENPQGEVLLDLAGDTGVRTARPVVQSPGTTGATATPIARERFSAAPEVITGALRRSLNVSETRGAAVRRLEGDYRALSAGQYNPLWARDVTPDQIALYEQRIAPLLSPDNPNRAERELFQDAMRRAERQFDLDRSNGIVEGDVRDNLPRYLHYIKGALGDAADFAATPLRGTAGREIASLRQIYRRFGDLLDSGQGQQQIIPGYRDITRQAGDYFTAREALEEGAAWLGQSADEIAARRAEMGAFELEHARIGLVDAISESVGLSARANGNVNVAGRQMFASPTMRQRIEATFDTPEQAADFLSTVNRQDELLRLAGQWGTGSQTFSNAAYGMDGMRAALETAGRAGTGDLGGAARSLGRQIGNAFSNDAIERGNNQFGDVVFRRIDNASAKAFTDEVERILRERAAGRNFSSTASRVGAAGVGVQQGQQR